MKITVVGAGSVGLCIAARLSRADCDVRLAARDKTAATEINRNGIEVHDPASGGRFRANPPALSGTAAIEDDGRLLLLCIRAPDTGSVISELAHRAPSSVVACAQNDVDNEARTANDFARVVGVVVRQTCTRMSPSSVNALGAGRIIVGAYTEAATNAALQLGAAFASAGFDVGISQDIQADKWLKLCVNLTSVPNALISQSEHATAEFVEIKAQLIEEARAVLAPAGIRAASCDGRDRSLDEEIDFHRSSLERGESVRRLPIYNAVWASLRHGSPLEADFYHGRITELGVRHDVPTPMNERARELVLHAQRQQLGPESLTCANFLEDLSPLGRRA